MNKKIMSIQIYILKPFYEFNISIAQHFVYDNKEHGTFYKNNDLNTLTITLCCVQMRFKLSWIIIVDIISAKYLMANIDKSYFQV